MKNVFAIVFTIAIIALVGFSFLEPLLVKIIEIFNTYLDGLFQFIQQFTHLGDCTMLMIFLVILLVFILINVFFG